MAKSMCNSCTLQQPGPPTSPDNSRSTTMKLAATLCVFLLFQISVQAQDEGTFDIGFSSPQAASLGKYGENNVDLSRGIARQSIPIYNVSIGDLSVPISLNYSSSGVKVKAVNSWTGIDWTVFAGGVISRTKRGNVDEEQYGYINTASDACFQSGGGTCSSGSTINAVFPKAVVDGHIDPEPDEFNYNFGPYSGRFLFDDNGDIYSQPYTDLKIVPTFSGYTITQFKVYNKQGVEYVFSEIEQYRNQSDPSTPQYTSAWYLTQINSPSGSHQITITYQEFDSKSTNIYYTKRIGNDPATVDQSTSYYYDVKVPHIITAGDLKVEFVKDNGALTGSTVDPLEDWLKEIKIYEDDNSSNLLTSFKFEYTGVERGAEDIFFLSRFYQTHGTNQTNEFEFEYYNLSSLATINRQEIDHWGYYNNNGSSSEYLPRTLVDIGGTHWYHPGVSRSVNPNYVHYGMLKKITYPTGGHSEYTYEPNEYGSVVFGGIGLEQYQTGSSSATLTSYTCPTGFSTCEQGTYSYAASGSKYVRSVITVDWDYTGPDPSVSDELQVQILKNGVQVMASGPIQMDDPSKPVFFQWEYELFVKAGSSDSFEVKIQTNYSHTIDFTFSTSDFLNKSVSKKYGPGVRISEIKTHDGMSTQNDIITEYDYDTCTGNTTCGIITTEPTYYYSFDPATRPLIDVHRAVIPAQPAIYFDALASNPISQLGSAISEMAVYSKVRVNHGVNAKFGYEESEFSTNPQIASPLEPGVFSTATNVSGQIGNLTSYKMYEKDGASYVLKRKVENDYTYYVDDSSLSYYKKLPALGIIKYDDFNYKQHWYEIHLSWVEKKWEKITTYENGQSFYTQKEYTYIEENKLPRTVTETNSLTTEKRVTEYAYAHEQSGSPNYSAMKNLNMLSQPYSVELRNDSDTRTDSKTWTTWSNSITGAVGTWLPEEQWVWKGTGSAPAVLDASNSNKIFEAERYDAYGNPLEVKDARGNLTKAYYGSDGKPFSQDGHNGTNGVYLTGIQQQVGTLDDIVGGVRPSGGDDLFQEVDYDNLGRIISVLDENEKQTAFDYDDFSRLIRATNPDGGVTSSKYFYSSTATGSFNASAPNYVESRTGTGGYTSDFENAGDFTSNRDAVFNHPFDGQTTLRLGDLSGNWSDVYRAPNVENVYARVDVYPSSDYTRDGYSYDAYVLGLNDGASGSPNRCAVRYRENTDRFYVYRRKNSGSWQEVHTFSMNAPANAWYTVELEKRGSLCMTWVYKQGESRSTGEYYEEDGYPVSWTPQVGMWSRDDYIYLTNLEIVETPTSSISYLDGLGRQMQTQLRGGSTVIATETLYNERGLPEVASRPIETTATVFPGFYSSGMLSGGGSFTPGDSIPSLAPVHSYYDPLLAEADEEDYAYSITTYEPSPSARVEETQMPGGATYDVTITYGLNTTEAFATSAQGSVPAKSWTANTLSKTVTEDPNSKKTIVYTDGWGRTIASGVDMSGDSKLTRGSTDLVTEFAYDERGNLVRVEDPRGLATTYTYNTLGQLTEKKLPDQEHPVKYKYDKAGQLRFSQDPNQQSAKQDLSQSLIGGVSVSKTIVANNDGKLSFNFSWLDLYLAGYDITIKRTEDNSTVYSNTVTSEWGSISTQTFNVGPGTYVFTGLAQDPGDIVSTAGTFAFESNDIFTYTKYDGLGRPTEVGEYSGGITFAAADPDTDTFPATGNSPNLNYYYDGDPAYSGSLTQNNPSGRLTKASFRDLSVSGSSWGHTWYSYNDLGLVEWVEQDLPGLSAKTVEYTYDGTGRLTLLEYQKGVSGEDFRQRYSYDELGRLYKVESSTNGTSWTEETEYLQFAADGQPIQQTLGNSTIQTVDYTYTVQGWLETINNGSIDTGTNGDRFGLELDYFANGNILSQKWRQAGATIQNPLTYTYTYDTANRLKTADFSGVGYGGNAFDLNFINYDKNGNILNYDRRDNNGSIGYDGIGYFGMTFESGTNWIDKITEQVAYLDFDVDHDASGNMIKNQLQGFTSVDYDWRNLPAQLIAGANTMQYAYDADGNRVRKELTSGVETHYVRGANGETLAIYEDDVLQFHNILAGSDIIGTWDGSERRYFLKDHLGTVRTTVDQSGNVDGYDDYYPFGLVMPTRSSSVAGNEHDYRFTGHERDDEAGLTIDYMMARNYDPTIGRFMQIDPLADAFPGWNPYHYTHNNPINMVDPTGAFSCHLAEGMDPSTCSSQYAMYSEAKHAAMEAGTYSYGFENTFAVRLEAIYGGYGTEGGHINPGGVDESDSDKDVLTWAHIALAAISADMVTPDPTDLSLPKWAIEALVATTATAALVIHANSDKNQNEHLVYEIFSTGITGDVETEKYGITSRKDNLNGGNGRPGSQVNRFQREDPTRAYGWREVTRTQGRVSAKTIEVLLVTQYVLANNGRMPPRQIRPRPRINPPGNLPKLD